MHALAHRHLIFQHITTMCSGSQIECHIKFQAGAIDMKAVNITNKSKSLRTLMLARA